MASHNHSHRTLNHHDPEADRDGNSDLQLWQDEGVCAVPSAAHLNRRFEAEALSPGTANLLEERNNRSTTAKVIDDGFAAPTTNINGYLDSSGNSGFILTPTGPFISPGNLLGEWNSLSSSMALHSTSDMISSTPNTYCPSLSSHDTIGQNPYLGTLNNNISYNIGPSASINDDLFLIHGDPYDIPPGHDYGHSMNHEFLENCMPDLQHDDPNLLLQVGMTTQQPLSNNQGPAMGLVSYNTGYSSPDRQVWNYELPRTEIGVAQFSVPSYQCSDDTPHVSENLLVSERTSCTSPASNTVALTAAIRTKSKQRRIMPKSLNRTIAVEAGGSLNVSMQAAPKPGRKGRMPEDKRVQAFMMRKNKACSACFASHVRCSLEDPCRRCVRLAKSPHLVIRCSRDNLRIYFESFSPDFLTDHLNQSVIEKLTNSLEFINNEMLLELSTGRSHPPISLLVCQFIPPNKDFLYIPGPKPNSQGSAHLFENIRTLEWAVLGRNADQLIPRCLQHIQTISNCEVVIGRPEKLSWKIMQAISCFQKTDPVARTNELVGTAIMVNHFHYVLGRDIYFSSGSVDKAIMSLQTTTIDIPTRSQVSAKILTKQIKGALTDLMKESTRDLLEKFNWELRNKRPETKLLCLMTHLLLCMSAAEVQWQVDSFIAFRLSRPLPIGCNPDAIRRAGMEICRRIEFVVLEHSWDLVRGKLRTLLRECNPFKYGYEVIESQFPKETERTLINELRDVMTEHEKEVFEYAAQPCLGGLSRTPNEASAFRESNIDRLVSKFLKKLY